jgi:soluble lytic murein transglycosylase-like protein
VRTITPTFWAFPASWSSVFVVVLILALLCVAEARANRLYSYVDENGVKVLTNLGGRRAPAESEQPPSAESFRSRNFIPLIQDSSRRYEVDEDLVRAIIKVESDFDPNAVSPKNCKGLMQLHPDTARRFGVSDVFDPAQNIEGGVRFLQYLMHSFDRNLDLVLAAYNAGENAVRRFEGIPPYAETIDYVAKVRTLYGKEPAREAARRPRRILRVIGPEGQVLLTNAPAGEEFWFEAVTEAGR